MRYLLLPLLFIAWALLWPVHPDNGASVTLGEIRALENEACVPLCQQVKSRAGILEGKLLFAQSQVDVLSYKVIRVNLPRHEVPDIENPNIKSD